VFFKADSNKQSSFIAENNGEIPADLVKAQIRFFFVEMMVRWIGQC